MSRNTLIGLTAVAFISTCLARQSRADINVGLIHHWKFDETEGNFAFDAVGGNTALLGGFAPDDPKWSIGKVGGALRFSKATNYALTVEPINHNQYTISFWSQLKVRSGVNPRLITPQESGWVGAKFESNQGIGAYLAYNPIEPAPNMWEHYVVTIDITTQAAKTYMNGVLVKSATTNLPAAVGSWMFAHNGDPNNHTDSWNGLLDDVRIYNRILLPAEVAELYPTPGDFNYNRSVGADDYLIWQGAFGTTPFADADNDNDSDGRDFLIWQRNFGVIRPGASAVPEPDATAGLLLLLTLTAALNSSSRRLSQRVARAV